MKPDPETSRNRSKGWALPRVSSLSSLGGAGQKSGQVMPCRGTHRMNISIVHNMMHLYLLYPYIVYPILTSRFGSMDLIHIIHILLSATSLIYINLKKGLIKHWKTMCSDAWKLSDIFSAPNPLGKKSISFI